jgi:hypothetical protein
VKCPSGEVPSEVSGEEQLAHSESQQGTEESMTLEEMAWEFAEIFDELDTQKINEVIAANVPIDTLNFFIEYSADFAPGEIVSRSLRGQLPNLMLVGYLLRSLEDKLELEDA